LGLPQGTMAGSRLTSSFFVLAAAAVDQTAFEPFPSFTTALA